MNSEDLPKILLIGDSISIGYEPDVRRALAGRFRVAHNEGNAKDSRNLLANLQDYLAADADATIVHVNCGLHDIKHQDSHDAQQVPLDQYRRNVTEIIDVLSKAVGQIIWAQSTPVVDTIHNSVREFHRYESDVLAYNAAAADVALAAGLAVNDLHAVVIAAGIAESLGEDGVHMTEAGYRTCGEAVAEVIVIGQSQTT